MNIVAKPPEIIPVMTEEGVRAIMTASSLHEVPKRLASNTSLKKPRILEIIVKTVIKTAPAATDLPIILFNR